MSFDEDFVRYWAGELEAARRRAPIDQRPPDPVTAARIADWLSDIDFVGGALIAAERGGPRKGRPLTKKQRDRGLKLLAAAEDRLAAYLKWEDEHLEGHAAPRGGEDPRDALKRGSRDVAPIVGFADALEAMRRARAELAAFPTASRGEPTAFVRKQVMALASELTGLKGDTTDPITGEQKGAGARFARAVLDRLGLKESPDEI